MNNEYRILNGELRMANCEWRIANGELRIATAEVMLMYKKIDPVIFNLFYGNSGTIP